MRPVLNDRFYDRNSLNNMCREMLSSILETSLPLTREAIGCGLFQTEIIADYTDEESIHILKNCIKLLASMMESSLKDNARLDTIKAENEILIQSNEALQKEVLELQSENAHLKQQENTNCNLRDEIKQLNAKLAKLENKLNRKEHTPNSENSGLPPSKDPISCKDSIRKHRQSLRTKSDRKSGGQDGHTGHFKELYQADTTEQRFPKLQENESGDSIICPKCGAFIPKDIFEESDLHQILDITENLSTMVKNIIVMKGKCPNCGNVVTGEFGVYEKGRFNYGPNINALVVLLNNRHAMPPNRIVELFNDLLGVKISEGTILNILERQAIYCKPSWYRNRDDICDPKNGLLVVHADETHEGELLSNEIIDNSPPQNEEKKTDTKTQEKQTLWEWLFMNRRSVFMITKPSRESSTITDIFGDELKSKILVTDRYKGYFTDDIEVNGHQVCLVHLARNLKQKTELYPKYEWAQTFFNLIKELMRRYNENENSNDLYVEFQKRIHDLLHSETMRSELPSNEAVLEINRFKKELIKYEDYMLTFLKNDEVPMTNNLAERCLRSTKTKLKVSGTFRTRRGSYYYAITHSIVQTAILRGERPYKVLIEIAKKAETVKERASWDYLI